MRIELFERGIIMSKRNRNKPSKSEELLEGWEEINAAYANVTTLDLMKIKHLIYNTFVYFRAYKRYNSVPREDLPIYKEISIFSVGNYYPKNCRHYEFECCIDFVNGLLWAIENDFERGYSEECLHLGLEYHDMSTEADMSSYETYEKCFRKHLVMFMRDSSEYQDGELDEQEELDRIASYRDSLDEKKSN